MLKKMTMALLMTTAILAGSMSVSAKETVDQNMINQAKKIREQIATINKDIDAKKTKVTSLDKEMTTLKKEISTAESKLATELKPKKAKVTSLSKEIATLKSDVTAQQKKVNSLLVKAADLETNAHKMGKQCQQGSHKSIDTIKKAYKNCGNCKTVDIKDGECARVKGAHKHYYCFCDC